MTAAALYLQLYNPGNIALDYGLVIKRFQAGIVLLLIMLCAFLFLLLMMINEGLEAYYQFLLPGALFIPVCFSARYGVGLERGPFDKRTADYVWMLVFGAISLLVMAVVPYLLSPFMGPSVVFMIVYVWSREFPNARINIYGLVSLKLYHFGNYITQVVGYIQGFYLPWAFLGLDLIFGDPLKPDIVGMVAGHLYYFLTVLHPLAGGKLMLKTPLWVHKLVSFWGEGTQINSPVERNPHAGVAFRGRSFRLNGRTTTPPQTTQEPFNNQQPAAADGVAFRGRSQRLNGR
ncbi:DERLIN-1 [Prunus dulcis]|uniref:Derlin n=1 Tax=Prunus dulcis TaxID=3755 RepID=A0A4Y1R266_PRUDU|nr:DERLIN-1 [Prunus dulcis]